jgi:hypothetical protein
MAQTDVRQDGADYNRLALEWKETISLSNPDFRCGPFHATSG